MAAQRDKRVEVSALLRAGHKVSEVANLVRVSRTTVYAIKKRMDDGEGVNRRAGSGRKSVVDRDSLRDAIESSPLTSMRQHARRLGVGTATVRRAVAKLGVTRIRELKKAFLPIRVSSRDCVKRSGFATVLFCTDVARGSTRLRARTARCVPVYKGVDNLSLGDSPGVPGCSAGNLGLDT